LEAATERLAVRSRLDNDMPEDAIFDGREQRRASHRQHQA
jgi:hypothetical protein